MNRALNFRHVRKSKTAKRKNWKLEIPDYFTKELKKNKAAKEHFSKDSNLGKKGYIEWFEEAKQMLPVKSE